MRTATIGLACFALGMAVMWMILSLDFSLSAGGGAESPDELARAAFEALRTEDFESFVDHVPDQDDLNTMLDEIRSTGTKRQIEKAERRLERDGGVGGMAAKHMDANRTRFAVTLKRARESGLDWGRAEYAGIDEAETRLSERYGIRGGDIYFRVRAGEREYLFKLDNCASPGGVWTCGSGIGLYPDDEPLVASEAPHTRPVDQPVERAPELVTEPERVAK